MPDRATLLVTLHPVTVGATATEEAAELVAALRGHQGPVLITGPSPDPGADAIRREMESLAASRPRTVFREFLPQIGVHRFPTRRREVHLRRRQGRRQAQENASRASGPCYLRFACTPASVRRS